ncbi:MAG: B12-binding domain-containing radical SAM protein [Spirochaetes bacterium]|nr:B12-binding domain-containing radical SAM protein [Spirochaetota bacterium]
MKIDIIVTYMKRYRKGHEYHFVPPLTGIHLAALTPPRHRVRVVHERVEGIDLDSDADLIALSFFTGFAPEAYALAREFKRRGKTVIAGGPHVTFSIPEASAHFDAVVTGEAESVWMEVLKDAEAGNLKPVYRGEPTDLGNLPTPRYDLIPDRYFLKKVVQATRGCPYRCSFCTVPSFNGGFRTRPVARVLADVAYDDFRHWWQRKIVWFWDDNLTVNRPFIKELLRGMIPLKKWWLTQASIDIVRDRELLELMEQSGCIGVFLGIESFGSESLRDAHKPQNRAGEYREAVKILHDKGICVMAGLISGFDHDTREDVVAMARHLEDIGIDVPFLSILTPYRGTPLYDALEREGRLMEDCGWEYYNGYNVVYLPKNMSSQELLESHRKLWRTAFSLRSVLRRLVRGLFTLRPGGFLLSLGMNGFYGLKNLRNNIPRIVGGSESTNDEFHDAKTVRRHNAATEYRSVPPAITW